MFNCEKCGACCRVIKCKHLTKDNLCDIYSIRPLICRVDEMYKIIGNKLTKKQYYDLCKKACKYLREMEVK
jgi:hypothetical protein